PEILQVNPSIMIPGSIPTMHFVVAKGNQNGSYLINDPFFSYTDLSAYNNQAQQAVRYTPANSDLSYISFEVDKNVTITAKDDRGNVVGQSYLENSPSNIMTNPPTPSNSVLNTFYFAKPSTGTYTITLFSKNSMPYQLDETFITKGG